MPGTGPEGVRFLVQGLSKGLPIVDIISKLKKSFEATKQSYGAWIAFGVCLAISGTCALVGVILWTAEFVGPIPACFLFAGLFVLAAGIVKLVIDAKEKEASHNFTSAKEEVKQDLAIITKPLKIVEETVPEHARPAVPIVLVACLILLAYFSKSQDVSPV